MFPVHRLDDSHRHFGTAIVQNSFQVIQQHLSQLLERPQPLLAQLIHPPVQVTELRAFEVVGPQPV
jgi:hypothetical protein